MASVIILLVLAVICGYGVYSYVHHLRCGGGCCGEREAPDRKVKVGDKNKSHYPYTLYLKVDGMTCGNCVRRVENALNRLDGVWASVEMDRHMATVRMKEILPEETLKKAVKDAGYLVLQVSGERF